MQNRTNKYHAKQKIVDGIKFQSILEADCYSQLKLLQKSDLFDFFLRQIPFDLPGHMKHRVDFCIFYAAGVKFIEVKGKDLPVGKMKRKQVEDIYNIEIHIVGNIKELNEII